MKKIWLMLLVICSVCAFSACSDDDDKKEEEKECPVTNVSITPDTAGVGEAITITGEGFDATAKFALQNGAGENEPMEATVNSDKEVACIIPAVNTGKYKVMLTQDGEWEIGTIEVIPVCPVKEISMLDTVEAEGTVTITGKGFASTAKLALQEGEETPMEIEADVTADEMTFKVPASFLGDYKVILIQNGEWNIGTITIIPAARELRVKQIIADYKTYDFTYDSKNRISSISLYPSEAPEEAMTFEIEYASDELINVTGFATFNLSLQNGRIAESKDVEGDDYTWKYDEEGYLTEGGFYECEYVYSDNNLTQLTGEYLGLDMTFTYNNPEYKNNLYLIDLIFILKNMVNYELFDEDYYFDMIPHMLGICGKRSENLPSQIDDQEGVARAVDYKYSDTYKDYVSEITYEYSIDDYPMSFTLTITYE
ncbi:MAG: IPT/TIG domain-containing protein [Odoribacter sp.]|nr:IPT/TIG domain-containing protein [Odoribacter sp.]